MNRTVSPQTIRKLAAVAMQNYAATRLVQTPAPSAHAVQMCDLPHVARHLLRFMDKVEKASAQTLRRAIGKESDVIPALGVLIRHQLLEAVHRSYRITAAGSACVNTAQPH